MPASAGLLFCSNEHNYTRVGVKGKKRKNLPRQNFPSPPGGGAGGRSGGTAALRAVGVRRGGGVGLSAAKSGQRPSPRENFSGIFLLICLPVEQEGTSRPFPGRPHAAFVVFAPVFIRCFCGASCRQRLFLLTMLGKAVEPEPAAAGYAPALPCGPTMCAWYRWCPWPGPACAAPAPRRTGPRSLALLTPRRGFCRARHSCGRGSADAAIDMCCRKGLSLAFFPPLTGAHGYRMDDMWFHAAGLFLT